MGLVEEVDLILWKIQKNFPVTAPYMALFAIGLAVVFFKTAMSQELFGLNSPPVLYVPDRNWRISEGEKIGQIIARISAEDAEKDNLIYGLEPNFNTNFGFSKGLSNISEQNMVLPFYVDPMNGVVSLNQSLVGRGGENFFLYITVSDGKLTAKNEIYVNVLKDSAQAKLNSQKNSNLRNAEQFSKLLPSFEQLSRLKSFHDKNYSSSQIISNIHQPGHAIINFKQNLPDLSDSVLEQGHNVQRDSNYIFNNELVQSGIESSIPTGRTKLKALNTIIKNESAYSLEMENEHKEKEPLNNNYEYVSSLPIFSRTSMIVFSLCGVLLFGAITIALVYQKRQKMKKNTMKTKSTEELKKISTTSNLNQSSAESRFEAMVMQHWNGPTAFGNRYVPCEMDNRLPQDNMIISSTDINGRIRDNSCLQIADDILENNRFIRVNEMIMTSLNEKKNGDSANNSRIDRWEVPRHRLKFFNILGEGAFGQVWRCEAVDIDDCVGITTVAVKTLKENASEMEKKDLKSELQIMKMLEKHTNVVRLLGCCSDKEPVLLIMEYVNCGKLQTYLRNSRADKQYGNTHGKSNVLTSGDLTSFMYQIAKGMDYLTSKGIIHRDLAARNILISNDRTCKVADFGFARDVMESKIYERKSEGKLPIRWMATESLYDNIFSDKSDIWSFGILMWEIVTLGSTPYHGISAAEVMRKVRDGYRLEKPDHCRRELYNIMYYCWSNCANERPSFSELVSMIEKLLLTEMDYIELERFPDHNYYNILSLADEKL